MADCACVDRDAKDCLAIRSGQPIAFGNRFDADECACLCHDEYYEQDEAESQQEGDRG